MRRRVTIKRHSPCAYLIVTWEQAPPGIVVLCRESRQQICPQAIPYASGFEPSHQRIGRRFRDLCSGWQSVCWPLAQRGRQNATLADPEQGGGPFLHQAGDPVAPKQLALQSLANLRWPQASALAYWTGPRPIWVECSRHSTRQILRSAWGEVDQPVTTPGSPGGRDPPNGTEIAFFFCA